MDETLIIYDGTGYMISQMKGNVREPIGIPFLWVKIPEKKRVVSIDVSVTPNIAVYEDVPLTELEKLQKDNILLAAQNSALTERAEFIEDIIAEMAMVVYT